MKCLFCERERHKEELSCDSEICREKVSAMTTEQLSEIRERECLEAWRKNPPPVDGRGVYIHFNPR
jgi:hypothetical protein